MEAIIKEIAGNERWLLFFLLLIIGKPTIDLLRQIWSAGVAVVFKRQASRDGNIPYERRKGESSEFVTYAREHGLAIKELLTQQRDLFEAIKIHVEKDDRIFERFTESHIQMNTYLKTVIDMIKNGRGSHP